MFKKSLLFLLPLAMLLHAGTVDKETLENIARMKYMKSYDVLNKQERLDVDHILTRRHHVLQLAEDSNISQSQKYKKTMEKARRSILMNQYLREKRASIKVSDAEISAYYQTHIQDYTTVHAYTIVNKKSKEALTPYIKILSQTKPEALKATFIELAKKHSQHPRAKQGGDMGFIGLNTIVKPFGQEAFKLKENSYNKVPFKTETLGWHLVYVEKRRVKPLEKVSDRIEDILRSKKYRAWFSTL